jgi:hypothetical protein
MVARDVRSVTGVHLYSKTKALNQGAESKRQIKAHMGAMMI